MEPKLEIIRPVSLHDQMHEVLAKNSFVLPSTEALEELTGFTDEHKRMKAQSFASIADEDKFRYISEKYVLEHLTGLSKNDIYKYYKELVEDQSLNNLVKILTKREIQEIKSVSQQSCQNFILASKTNIELPPDAVLEASTYQKKFLFATRDGIIDLHMRANRAKGSVWRDYFRKAEKIMHMQTICLDMIRMHQIEIKLQQEQAKAIEYNNRIEELSSAAADSAARAEVERQERIKLEVQIRLDELRHRFCVVDPAFYTPNGYLYIEASKDDAERSIIGFGMTSNPQSRLTQYHSKSTGPARREFLKIWKVWNMNLIETVIKELLAPWANPAEKQKPIHQKSGLSRIEIFDIPLKTIIKIIDLVIHKFEDITASLKQFTTTILNDANDPIEYRPIKDIKKYLASIIPGVSFKNALASSKFMEKYDLNENDKCLMSSFWNLFQHNKDILVTNELAANFYLGKSVRECGTDEVRNFINRNLLCPPYIKGEDYKLVEDNKSDERVQKYIKTKRIKGQKLSAFLNKKNFYTITPETHCLLCLSATGDHGIYMRDLFIKIFIISRGL